jgi:hypothetical protein
MVGMISFYDKAGERQHTIYMAATPEYGKATFLGRLEAEVARVKQKHPGARYVGIADGAKENWEFLAKHTDAQVVDFWHAAEYMGKAAAALYRGHPATREKWMEDNCHTLKHEPGGGDSRTMRTLELDPQDLGRSGDPVRRRCFRPSIGQEVGDAAELARDPAPGSARRPDQLFGERLSRHN